MQAPPLSPPAVASNVGSSTAFRLAVALVAVTIVVIVKGAMVTGTGSGLAFADWPLSDGEWMPARAYETLPGFFEHFHRIAGAVAGLLALALTVLVFRQPDSSRQARRAAVCGLVLIVVQGAVGGIGVLLALPVLTSVLHGTLAQLTIATFAVTAYLLSARWRATRPAVQPAAGAARKLVVVGVAALVLQTVLGAVARHSGDELALWSHVANAFVVFLLLLIACGFVVGRLAPAPGIRGLGRLLLWLLIAQVVLGFVALLVRTGKHPENIEHLWRASLISGHVLNGALLTLVTSLLAAHVFRSTELPAARVDRV